MCPLAVQICFLYSSMKGMSEFHRITLFYFSEPFSHNGGMIATRRVRDEYVAWSMDDAAITKIAVRETRAPFTRRLARLSLISTLKELMDPSFSSCLKGTGPSPTHTSPAPVPPQPADFILERNHSATKGLGWTTAIHHWCNWLLLIIVIYVPLQTVQRYHLLFNGRMVGTKVYTSSFSC